MSTLIKKIGMAFLEVVAFFFVGIILTPILTPFAIALGSSKFLKAVFDIRVDKPYKNPAQVKSSEIIKQLRRSGISEDLITESGHNIIEVATIPKVTLREFVDGFWQPEISGVKDMPYYNTSEMHYDELITLVKGLHEGSYFIKHTTFFGRHRSYLYIMQEGQRYEFELEM